MDDNTNCGLTPVDVKTISDVFEKTLLETSIVESLYGNTCITEHLKNVFRNFIEDVNKSGTLTTVAGVVDAADFTGREDEKNERNRDGQRLQDVRRSNGGKNMQTLKREQDDIDSIVEKRTEIGEQTVIRRETEKNYVDKWERARVENFRFKFKTKELQLQRKITELQVKLKTEKTVDTENERFLNYSINELKNQIEYWERKNKTDTMEMDNKLKSLMETLNEKTKEVNSLKQTYNERQIIIEEHESNKRKLEEAKKLHEHREKMATKIQAWWRGIMVRQRLGPYKNLLGPRKKSLKKPLVNKRKKSKGK